MGTHLTPYSSQPTVSPLPFIPVSAEPCGPALILAGSAFDSCSSDAQDSVDRQVFFLWRQLNESYKWCYAHKYRATYANHSQYIVTLPGRTSLKYSQGILILFYARHIYESINNHSAQAGFPMLFSTISRFHAKLQEVHGLDMRPELMRPAPGFEGGAMSEFDNLGLLLFRATES